MTFFEKEVIINDPSGYPAIAQEGHIFSSSWSENHFSKL